MDEDERWLASDAFPANCMAITELWCWVWELWFRSFMTSGCFNVLRKRFP
jgi:hypothetical protein